MTLAQHLVLDDSALRGLTGNQQLVSAFPALANLKAQIAAAGGGCGCGSKSAAAPDYNGVRASLAGMSVPDQAKFKALAGAAGVSFHYAAGGRVKSITF